VTGSMSPSGELNYTPETVYSTASTQTPPEFALPEDEIPAGRWTASFTANPEPIPPKLYRSVFGVAVAYGTAVLFYFLNVLLKRSVQLIVLCV